MSDTASSEITKSQTANEGWTTIVRGNINRTGKESMAARAAKNEAAVPKKQDGDAASAPAVMKWPTAAKRRKGKRTIPLPTLPMGYKIAFRPRGLDFARVSAADVLSAVVSNLGLLPREVCSHDKFRINPRINTITVGTPDEDVQLAYLQIWSLVIGGKTHEVTTHMATPSDSTRIVVPKALSFEGTEDAEDILLSCIEQNPQWQACVNCRRTGHRADVCPMPPQSRCHRCGAQTPSQNEDGSHYKCQPLCAICGGRHITASKQCSHRYVRRPEGRGPAPTEPEKQRRRSRKSRSRDSNGGQRGSRARSSSVFFPTLEGRGPGAFRNRSDSKNRTPKEDWTAWASASAAGAESALVKGLRRQISDTQQQLMGARVSKPTTSAQTTRVRPPLPAPPATNIQDTPLNPETSLVHVVPEPLWKPWPVPENKSRKRQATKAALPPLTERDVKLDADICSVVCSETVLALEQRQEARQEAFTQRMESRQTALEQAIEKIRHTQQQMQQQMLQMQQQIPQILQALPLIQEQLHKLQLLHG
ncbi:hypothetical protein HPB47_018864 [Ixodes persulcatus]|uniref:Uncharacterized protein n=1 Tax=Ixodes persulcatus TaxID=34615 RepID=A0AC60QKI6_IXOPE|nr:hypothetical protein HPB47_018864 [Ixodes persulcatus]